MSQNQPLDTRSRLLRARESAGITGPWAGAETKERWVAQSTPLYLHSIQYEEDGKYGERWILAVTEEIPTGQKIYVSLSDTDLRNRVFRQLREDLERDPTPIGPLQLVLVKTKRGRETYDLQPYESDDLPF